MGTSSSFARTRTSVKSGVLLVFIAALAAISAGMLRGSMPDVQTGTWTATGSLAGARSGAASVLLTDGSVLVTGGSDGSASVDAVESFGSDGAFSAAAAMSAARADHSAVLLNDGHVLVVGGRNAAGAVASAEILVDGAWLAAGALADARWGHTATLLADGRVLIAGGENAGGTVGSIEIFNLGTGQVSVAGTMLAARKGHAAARLADGRVLIAGGSNTAGVLNSTEIFDPETGSTTPGPALLSKRAGFSATTLLDGRVLFLGGNNGASNLASAELFNPATGTFAATASASVARRDHQAFLLPNNNAVLIVGGIADVTVNGVTTSETTASAELFLPWLQEVWPTGAMSSARAKATGAALSAETYGAAPAGDGLLMVAGGEGLNGSEAYRFATIRTDKNDYAPGDIVYVSGSGWQPNETVTFRLREVPVQHPEVNFTTTADASGNIGSAELTTVEPHDLNTTFFLTARGAASQAQVTFTDGNVRIRSNANGVTFTLKWNVFNGTSCGGSATSSGTELNVGFAFGARFTKGVGNAESITLEATATSNQGGGFLSWTSTAPFTVVSPRIICISGQFTGTHDSVATYKTANNAPTAVADTYSVAEGGTLNVAAPGVLGNDTDPQNDALTAQLLTSPTQSTSFSLNANGAFSYVHNGSDTTVDSFTYRACDAGLDNDPATSGDNLCSATATVTITVIPVNDAPVANDDSGTTNEDTAKVFTQADLKGNDTDVDNTNAQLSVTAVSNATNGTVVLNGDGTVTFTPTANFNGTAGFDYTVSDGSLTDTGHVTITVTAVNDASANVTASLSANSIDENQSTTLSGSFTDPDTGDTHTVTINWGDGSTDIVPLAAGTFTYSNVHQYLDDPTIASDVYQITVTVTDNGSPQETGTANTSITVKNVAPVVTMVTGPTGPQPIGSTFSVTGTFTDQGTLDTHTCSVNWDDGTTSAGVVNQSTDTCTASHVYMAPGVYSIVMTITDDDGGQASRTLETEFAVIFDPNGGFVTGGGWIMSPAGASVTYPTATGKANFGFVSKYKKGSNIPEGQTEFQFKAGDLNFHSSAYDLGSLVVAGWKAQYRGTGEINGVGGYQFVLTAYDGQAPGGNGLDRFRMKITKNGVVVYDNRFPVASDDMDAADPMVISGGSIVIHK